jgi:hypothetical protein
MTRRLSALSPAATRLIVTRSVLCLTVLTLACAGPSDGVAGPGTLRVARPGGSTNASVSIVGTWRRAFFFFDDFGISRSTETIWQFSPDGTAARTIITRNLDFGLTDVQLSVGRWETSGSTVVINIISPSAVRFEFSVRVAGDQLELAGEQYLRVTT